VPEEGKVTQAHTRSGRQRFFLVTAWIAGAIGSLLVILLALPIPRMVLRAAEGAVPASPLSVVVRGVVMTIFVGAAFYRLTSRLLRASRERRSSHVMGPTSTR